MVKLRMDVIWRTIVKPSLEAFKLNIGHCHVEERTVCVRSSEDLIYKGGEHKGKFNKLLFHEVGHILWPGEQHTEEWKIKVSRLHNSYLEIK